jgi:hypothetical protein
VDPAVHKLTTYLKSPLRVPQWGKETAPRPRCQLSATEVPAWCKGVAIPPGSGRFRPSFEPSEPAQVGDQVGEPQLGRGASEADRANDQAKPAFLGGEHVFDSHPDPCPRGVAARDMRRHRPSARLRPLELGHQSTPRQ